MLDGYLDVASGGGDNGKKLCRIREFESKFQLVVTMVKLEGNASTR